ncbi:MAG TPA: hypothetical protein VGX76_11985 [Pirellulales bacterium]|jgi:hypothetical protein|nr:hypothetical protein [Pirellulales bacterium]
MNYNARAKRIANFVHSRRLDSHRGVMPLPEPGVSAVFGNDDYSGDRQTRELVRRMFEVAHDAGYEVLGFATNDGAANDRSDDAGRSWAVVFSTDELDWLKARLHDAFFESRGLYAPHATTLGAAAGQFGIGHGVAGNNPGEANADDTGNGLTHSGTYPQEKPR